MSRKIKMENKTTAFAARNNEIIQVADIVAKDKGVDREEILEAMELAILKTSQLKYGLEKDIIAGIDRKTGEISIKRRMTIVDSVTDPQREVSLTEAKEKNKDAEVGDFLCETLPIIEFGRIAAQSARQIITEKIRNIERERQFEAFSGRVGEIITGIVKRTEFQDIVLDVGKTEGILKRNDTIKNETFKVGDRIKVLLVSINKESSGPMLHLSRSHNDFLRKLFEQEVPEIYDGIVRIVHVARDPGSKAKIAVTTSDSKLDPIGACVGVKGSRVQAVTDELKGEKIDIIEWSENQAAFIVNALSPAEVIRIVMDEDRRTVDTVVPNDQLSLAIGRRGQNVRLASRLTGWTISVMTGEDDVKKRAFESARLLKHFMENLDIDDMVAHLLMAEGYLNIDEIAECDLSELAGIEGFDEDTAKEIQKRASLAIEKKKKSIESMCKEKGVESGLINYGVISAELLEVLVGANIKSLNDLGDLSTDELLDITGEMLNREEAEALIMDIRKNW
ncbi:MAG: transcription termination factor NusA [Holosporales bacterium]|nr:transcription termination factor NusA [Holosporales bacterium]